MGVAIGHVKQFCERSFWSLWLFSAAVAQGISFQNRLTSIFSPYVGWCYWPAGMLSCRRRRRTEEPSTLKSNSALVDSFNISEWGSGKTGTSTSVYANTRPRDEESIGNHQVISHVDTRIPSRIRHHCIHSLDPLHQDHNSSSYCRHNDRNAILNWAKDTVICALQCLVKLMFQLLMDVLTSNGTYK